MLNYKRAKVLLVKFLLQIESLDISCVQLDLLTRAVAAGRLPFLVNIVFLASLGRQDLSVIEVVDLLHLFYE